MIYIFGGAASGKSAYAEELSLRLAEKEKLKKIYIATMKVSTLEDKKKVDRHKELRKDKDFYTVEFEAGLKNADKYKDNLVLLECISNLTANLMFTSYGIKAKEKVIEEVIKEIRYIKENSKRLIVVGNDFSLAKGELSEETKAYLFAVENIHKILIEEAGSVTEVIFGLENSIK